MVRRQSIHQRSPPMRSIPAREMLRCCYCGGLYNVVYDPNTRRPVLLHPDGTDTDAVARSRARQDDVRGCVDPENIIVWMSPMPTRCTILWNILITPRSQIGESFAPVDGYHLDLQGYNQAICLKHGLRPEHIHTSPINTVTDPESFSHSAHDVSGRFAVCGCCGRSVVRSFVSVL